MIDRANGERIRRRIKRMVAEGKIPTRPIRAVISEIKGAGSDSVTLVCGHKRTLNHRAKPRVQAECLLCQPKGEA